jgi:hypothetical protein
MKKRYCTKCQTGYFVERGVEVEKCVNDGNRITLLGRNMVPLKAIKTVKNVNGLAVLI